MPRPHHGRYGYVPIIDRPDFDWPAGKRLAFYLALNVEDFADIPGLTVERPA